MRRVLAASGIAALVGLVGWQIAPRLAERRHVSATPLENPASAGRPARISALGRLEPRNGVIRVAGPSQFAIVISRLLVEEGASVRAGEVIAILDTFDAHEAAVARLDIEVRNAEEEYHRYAELYRNNIVSVSLRDHWLTQLNSARADLRRARAELELATVRAPITGQVLAIHARPGERVGPEGIAELGQTAAMYAVAEVCETDVTRVRVGQHAVVTSPALPREIHGTVDHIGLKIRQMRVLDRDPAAQTDARVAEVKIRLEDSQLVAGLTNLRVDVTIVPEDGPP